MRRIQTLLLFLALTIILSCQVADQGCKQLEGDTTQVSEEVGCNLATGDTLCTEQCKKDFPPPTGKTTFGKADTMRRGSLDCKCYQKRL